MRKSEHGNKHAGRLHNCLWPLLFTCLINLAPSTKNSLSTSYILMISWQTTGFFFLLASLFLACVSCLSCVCSRWPYCHRNITVVAKGHASMTKLSYMLTSFTEKKQRKFEAEKLETLIALGLSVKATK